MKVVHELAASEGAPRWGYLAFALTMLHLVRRARNKDVVKENMISFATALLPTELSHKFLALNAGVVYWLVRKSKTPLLSGWVGSVAGVVQCIVLVRLAEMYRSNVSAKHCIRDAMVEQSDISEEKLAHVGNMSFRNWLSVMLPLPQTMALSLSYPGVQNIGTLVYAHVGKNSMTKLKMDVYKHKSNCKLNAPILLYVHGGGWVMGDRKNPPRPLIHQVATLGWVVCVIDYRLSPKVAFPEHLIDSKRAIAFLREHARESPLLSDTNPEFIVVGGESAGGHLASLVALTASDKSLQPGFEHVDTSVRGCIDTYGVHDFKDRHGIYFYKDKGYSFMRFIELVVMQKKLKEASDEFDQASPMSWVLASREQSDNNISIPPFLVSHGTHDTLVPFKDSVLFFENLQKYRRRISASSAAHGGVEDVFLEIPDAHHAFNYLVSPRALAHGEAVCVFLENLYETIKHLPLGSSAATMAAIQDPVKSSAPAEAVSAASEVEDPLARFSLAAERPTRVATISRLIVKDVTKRDLMMGVVPEDKRSLFENKGSDDAIVSQKALSKYIAFEERFAEKIGSASTELLVDPNPSEAAAQDASSLTTIKPMANASTSKRAHRLATTGKLGRPVKHAVQEKFASDTIKSGFENGSPVFFNEVLAQRGAYHTKVDIFDGQNADF